MVFENERNIKYKLKNFLKNATKDFLSDILSEFDIQFESFFIFQSQTAHVHIILKIFFNF